MDERNRFAGRLLEGDEDGIGRCSTQGYTYPVHPAACAAALTNIEIMERDSISAKVDQLRAEVQIPPCGLAT